MDRCVSASHFFSYFVPAVSVLKMFIVPLKNEGTPEMFPCPLICLGSQMNRNGQAQRVSSASFESYWFTENLQAHTRTFTIGSG